MFPRFIMRVDSVRYMYMYVYGGLYADMDVACLKPMTPLLRHKQVVLARMGEDRGFEHSIPNAWFASVPGHPFWLQLLWTIHGDAQVYNASGQWPGVEWITGPVMLKRVWDMLPKRANGSNVLDRESQGHCLHVLPPGTVYPMVWSQAHAYPESCKQKNLSDCAAAFPDAYAFSFWSHSWG